MRADRVVVGAGLFGLTVAEHAAARGLDVAVMDGRDHVGGSAWSEVGAVAFGGRLDSCQYLDMHMAIASALRLVDNDLAGLLPVSRGAVGVPL
jgi:UDP-galactopyranose mutase